MRWQGRRSSSNVSRGGGGRGIAGGGALGLIFMLVRFLFQRFGLWSIVIIGAAVIGLYAIGIDPVKLVSNTGQSASTSQSQANQGNPCVDGTDAEKFLCVVLGSTEDVWHSEFRKRNAQYEEPKLVLFKDNVQAGGCGFASAAVGPFYCPANKTVYLDISFFDMMAGKMDAGGDFAQAYVIAHEVGHHIQRITGTLDQAQRLKAQTDKVGQNQVQVRIELQADCYSGVWAYYETENLEEGDIQEALGAAKAVGDDTLQRKAGRQVQPETFSHGSSEQRMRWFKRGFQSGKMESCDTFNTAQL